MNVLTATTAMSERTRPFLAEIRHFGFGYAPSGWAACDGRLLSIDEQQPLFSLVGWRFGGDRATTFAVPAVHHLPVSLISCIALDGVYAPGAGEPIMDEPIIGEIRMFAGWDAPAGWVVCDGRLLSIEPPHDALFRVIGTTYGGDELGFNVPDLRGQSPDAVSYIIAVTGVAPSRSDVDGASAQA